MAANNADFHGLTFDYEKIGSLHYLEAHKDGEVVGKLNWEHPKGNISGLHVSSSHRRTGIGTALWKEANRIAGSNKDVPAPKITGDRTKDGEAWARSLGIRLPKNRNL